jgi:phage/plasmid-like protein (TIGR03299 family)
MSHNLNIREDGQASFFSVREKAWHGLGLILPDCPNSEEAIKLAGLDYEVTKIPNFAQLPSGEFMRTGSFSTMRTDNNVLLGDRLGKEYTVVQNREAFEFFDNIVGAKEAIFETAGAIGQGEIIFITAKLPNVIKVANHDEVENYLLLCNSHDGSLGIVAMFTPIRVVCNNTLSAAINGKGMKLRIKHTKDVRAHLAIAQKVISMTSDRVKDAEEAFNLMAKKSLSDIAMKQYIEYVVNPKLRLQEVSLNDAQQAMDELVSGKTQLTIDSIYQYAFEGPGQNIESTRGTVWGAYNAITGFYNNVKSYKTQNQRMNTLYFGQIQKINQRAFDLAMELV